MPNTYWKTKSSTKTGIVSRTSVAPRIVESIHVRRFTAATMANVNPTTTSTPNDPSASRNVTGNRSFTISETLRPVKVSPKFPTRTPLVYRRNCTKNGRSR